MKIHEKSGKEGRGKERRKAWQRRERDKKKKEERGGKDQPAVYVPLT